MPRSERYESDCATRVSGVNPVDTLDSTITVRPGTVSPRRPDGVRRASANRALQTQWRPARATFPAAPRNRRRHRRTHSERNMRAT